MFTSDPKIDFISYTLLNLCFQVCITLITSYQYRKTKVNNKWILFILSLGIMLMLNFMQGLPFIVRFVLLVVFSYINGLVLSGIMKHVPKEEINSIIQQTIVMFVTMFMVGWYINHRRIEDVSALYYAILSLTFVSVGLSLYAFFVDRSRKMRKITRTLIIIISSLYIIYDTYHNFSNELPKDVVTSTMNYYLDVYNIMSILFSGHQSDNSIDGGDNPMAMNVFDEF